MRAAMLHSQHSITLSRHAHAWDANAKGNNVHANKTAAACIWSDPRRRVALALLGIATQFDGLPHIFHLQHATRSDIMSLDFVQYHETADLHSVLCAVAGLAHERRDCTKVHRHDKLMHVQRQLQLQCATPGRPSCTNRRRCDSTG